MTTTEKKIRVMSAKGFLHKANGNVAPAAFLAAHRAWLETGELAQVTSPILADLDAGKILPTPAKLAIQQAVLNHSLLVDLRKAEASIVSQSAIKAVDGKKKVVREPKSHSVGIFDEAGNLQTRQVENAETGEMETKDLAAEFDKIQDAQGWVDRRLTENPNCHGIITSHKLQRADGSVWVERIERDNSLGRIFARKGSPIMKSSPKSTSRLGFGVKVKNDRSVFSAG